MSVFITHSQATAHVRIVDSRGLAEGSIGACMLDGPSQLFARCVRPASDNALIRPKEVSASWYQSVSVARQAILVVGKGASVVSISRGQRLRSDCEQLD